MSDLSAVLGDVSTPIQRDLSLNLKRLMSESTLDEKEATLALLSLATSVHHPRLAQFARDRLAQLDFPADQIREAEEAAAIMGMLNTYYRFRHFLREEQPDHAEANYTSAGLRMTALGRPHLGKTQFEMLAFAVSVVNGCESCVNSHEQALRHAGIEVNKIHDLARLASVVKGISVLHALS